MLALILFSSALGSIPALLIREVFDVALPDRNLALLNVLVVAMIAIVLTSRGPALYRAHRIGRDGKLCAEAAAVSATDRARVNRARIVTFSRRK